MMNTKQYDEQDYRHGSSSHINEIFEFEHKINDFEGDENDD